MFKTPKLMRSALICLPVLVASLMAIFMARASVGTPPTTPTQISDSTTMSMANYEAYPSGVNALAAPNVPPLIMLVMSRDEQLFNKAYPDFTDLDGDGIVDTTYVDAFAYNGYFDPTLCYTYSSTTNTYAAAANVTTGSHKCATGNKYWSGNFLNWVAMSRLDVLRWTFYGGTRSTDTATKTILERAEITNDLHAWAKVYSGSDIASLAPFTGTTTFCNVSTGGTWGKWTAPTTTTSGVSTTPKIRTASGAWGDWASTAKAQCLGQQSTDDGGNSGRPTSITDYTARVQVCQNTTGVPNESFCVTDGSALKPEGLLQKYSKVDTNVKRFGLVTGSTVNARIGGQLRRNIGQLANNITGTACATGTGTGDGDEFSSVDGTFCYKSASTAPTEGIVMTLDRFQISGWNGSDYGDSYGTAGDSTCHGDSTPWGARGNTIQTTPTMCPDFGNPLAGMYAQALRYIQGASASNGESSSTLPTPSWVDPYGTASGSTTQRNQSCASCSIVLVSSGLNTFDYAADVPSVNNLTATTLTDSVQTAEGISGKYQLSTYYNTSSLTGAPTNGTLTTAGTKYSDIAICAPTTIGNLSTIVGICNGAPGQQGSYLIAGLSYGAWTTPVRTDSAVKQPFQVKTYGIQLSDNLPSFNIPVGGSQISISPSCRADPTGGGTYTTCYIGSVRVGAQQAYNTSTATGYNTYGMVPTTTYPNVGSFYFVWEDSQYGSDHDQDANNVISYCVGKSCNMPSKVTSGVAICDPVYVSNNTTSAVVTSVWGGACDSTYKLKSTPGDNDVIIRNQLTAYSSNGMLLGYQISGSSNDGLFEFKITNGGANTSTASNGAIFNCNLLGNINCKSSPEVEKFTLGTTAAVQTLQSPLWYAAKYSGFTGTAPATLPAGQDPSNYFFARNAGALKSQLDAVFQAITSSAANNFGNATTPSSSNDIKGNGVSYQVQYFAQRNGVKWNGSFQAFWVDSNGYEREGTTDGSGNQVLDQANAPYIVAGPDNSPNALAGARTSYICSIVPVAPAGGTFDPTSTANASSCAVMSATNPLVPAWDAASLLNATYDSSTTAGAAAITNLGTQRAYGSDAGASGNIGQRYIFTYLTATPNGSSSNGTVVNGTQTDFVWNSAACDSTGKYTLSATSGFCGGYDSKNKVRTGNYGLLNEQNPTLAQSLLLWVRGKEDPTYRSRVGTSTSPSTYRLGDIIDSSPAIVGTPSESFDLLYSDFSYAAFRQNYQSRRQMVYVGANDGMLHAFNGGFYLTGQAATSTTSATKPSLLRQLTSASKLTSGDSSVPLGNNWSLGQEVWAFIPDNLLAHLRWMADKNYTHVFYVDGSPVVSDVKIFGAGSSATCLAGTPNTTKGSSDIDASGHVCGWGTVIVVPFRLGGGPISVGVTGSGATTDMQMSNSAYIIMDVTDPEQPPKVLGEITTGTFTSSAPAFAVHKETDGKLHFLLTIGSGSADNGGALGTKAVAAPSGGTLGVWVYDLATIVANTSTPAASFTTTGPANSFAGDMVSSDFDLDDSAEGVYFGVVTNPPPASKPPAAPVPQIFGGGVWKVDMRNMSATTPDVSDPASWTLKEVINVGQPVTARPTIALDGGQRPTVFFGTGRSYTVDDNSGTSAAGTQQQYIYGVVDNSMLTKLNAACQVEATTGSLYNASSTSVVINSDGTNTVTGSGVGAVTNVASLESALLALSQPTGKTYSCYTYSGWQLALTAGNAAANVQQPSERVINSQTLLGGILTTPTYIPPNLTMLTAAHNNLCNPVPVPGTSYVYGLDYLTGSASPGLATFFGTSTSNGVTTVQNRVSVGSGQASAPVLHVGSTAGGAQTVKACFNIGGVTVCKDISALNAVSSGEISWREAMENL